jgi:hypothetical protein
LARTPPAIARSRDHGQANIHWPLLLMFLHPAFAFTGAVVFFMYLMYDERSLALITIVLVFLTASGFG